MKKILFCILLASILLFSGCGDASHGNEDSASETAESVSEPDSSAESVFQEEPDSEGGSTSEISDSSADPVSSRGDSSSVADSEPPSEPDAPVETKPSIGSIPEQESFEAEDSSKDEVPEQTPSIVLPQPYIDIEFDENYVVSDAMGHVDCEIANEDRGSVVMDAVTFDGNSYEIPHYRVRQEGGVLKLTYLEVENVYDLYEVYAGGFTMEAFLVNYSDTNASSAEQCMISSTQSGGYNLTTLRGKYTASVYTDGAYRNAILSEDYDRDALMHLVSVYDQNTETLSLYVNGECVDTVSAPGLIGYASGECYKTLIIGGDINSDGGANLLCKSLAVADFKFYRTPLDTAQCEALYSRAVSELTGDDPELSFVEGESALNEGDALFDHLFDSFAEDLYQPDTALVNPPTVLEYANRAVTAISGASVRPATVILHTVLKDGELYAAMQDGYILGSMYDIVKSLDKKLIPAFYFDSADTGAALRDFINENYIADCFLICPEIELLARIADATFAARPLLDCTAWTEIDADEMLLETAKGGVKTVLLNAAILDPETVTALRARAVSVVAVLPSNATVLQIHNAVHSAVSGIVTEDSMAVFDYYETIRDTTLCITPLIVAHRGDPESHPDNMLRSLISAAQSSATSIELDIWMTKDGHIVLNHDNVTTNFNEVIRCNDATREQLKALTYVGPNAEEGDEIAFLDEVFAVFSTEYTDKVLTIEVKDVREAVIDEVIALAEEYGMTGRIQLIGMNHKVSNYTYETYGLSAQMNQSYLVKKAYPEMSLKLAVLESTCLHSACFTQHSQENPEFMQELYHRLIKYSTWTSKTTAETLKNYLCGAVEYTTNMPHALDDFYRYLTVSVSDNGAVKVTGVTYIGDEVDVTDAVALVVLEGSGSFQNGTLSGTGIFAFRLENEVSGSVYYLYTPAVER